MKEGITVFTPSYNREHTLSRLYNSLINQKYKNFEWLIVDDGSTDNTKNLIKKFQSDDMIDINYIYQDNHGKSYAYNEGVKNAKYEWFICVDSDDFLTDDALETIFQIIDANSSDFVGIVSLRKNIINDNIRLGKKLANGEKIYFAELYRKYKCNGDTAVVYKTNILKRNLFPIIENEKFIPEQLLHDKMDLEGKLLYLNKKIYFGEYLSDGYTNNTIKLLKNNPQGYLLAGNQRLKYSKILKHRIYGAVQVNIAINILNKKLRNYFKEYNLIEKLFLIITKIPAYIYYKKRYN